MSHHSPAPVALRPLAADDGGRCAGAAERRGTAGTRRRARHRVLQPREERHLHRDVHRYRPSTSTIRRWGSRGPSNRSCASKLTASEIAGEATVVRRFGRVNGRVPRERDKKDRAGCTDPSPVAPEPLAFLLPAHRSEYRFRIGGNTNREKPACPADRLRVRESQKQTRADSGTERPRRLLRLDRTHRLAGTHLGRCRKLRRATHGAWGRRPGRREGARVDTTPAPPRPTGSSSCATI